MLPSCTVPYCGPIRTSGSSEPLAGSARPGTRAVSTARSVVTVRTVRPSRTVTGGQGLTGRLMIIGLLIIESLNTAAPAGADSPEFRPGRVNLPVRHASPGFKPGQAASTVVPARLSCQCTSTVVL